MKDIDYTLDDKGNPVKTPQGTADTSVPWLFVATSLPVLFDSNDPTFVPTAHPNGAVADGKPGARSNGRSVFHPTHATKVPVVLQKFNDGLGEIVTGAAPLGNSRRSSCRTGDPGAGTRCAPNTKSRTPTLNDNGAWPWSPRCRVQRSVVRRKR